MVGTSRLGTTPAPGRGVIRVPANGGKPHYWWSGSPDERYWMEIRRVPGIGVDLWSSDHDEDGMPDPWYELLASVRAGEIVYHYSAREQRIVGRSITATAAVHDTAERTYRVVLKDFEPLDGSANLAALRDHADELYDLRDTLQARYGSPLYLPFQFYENRAQFRPMSNYFTKLPRSFVEVLFAESSDDQGPANEEDAGREEVTPTPPGTAFLAPFKPKADTNYIVEIAKTRRTATRRHETLVNDFAAWLLARDLEPGRNAAIDLGLTEPPVIFEAKTINASWADAIRQAVGQLYEYRYFKIASPAAELVFLSEKPVPPAWLEYLERDRHIGAVWPEGGGWHFSPIALKAIGHL